MAGSGLIDDITIHALINNQATEDNQALLRLIRDRRPKSLTELAELTGRQVPNLSRSLRMMEGYGLVRLKRDAHGVEPEALATSFKILID